MASALGSQNFKEIRIEKNDNAEGTIEFLSDAQSFIGEYRNNFIISEVQYHSGYFLQLKSSAANNSLTLLTNLSTEANRVDPDQSAPMGAV